jgi:hypothetical protein
VEPADGYTFLYVNGNSKHLLGSDSFVNKGIISAVKGIHFVSDRMTYINVRGCWCDIVVNVHDSAENKSEITKSKEAC